MNNIYDNSTRQEKKDSYILHHIVAILLWLVEIGRNDFETAILFL